MTDTFTWRATSQTSGTATGGVRRAQFGDGYSQSAADGINPLSRSYHVSFTGPKAQMQQIADFMDAHVGVSFYWTAPFGGRGYYQCDEYSDANEGADVFTITATFKQVFQP